MFSKYIISGYFLNMKTLKQYLECDGAATPGNTIGMGNPMAPTETSPGSEPLPTAKAKKEKIKKNKKRPL